MKDAKQRLTHLIELATQNVPESRRMLAVELCDLLSEWPQHYPLTMREPFEALLEKTIRAIDEATRRQLAAKLAPREETPLPLLNEFYFDVPEKSRESIVLRNALIETAAAPANLNGQPDETALIAAARSKPKSEFTEAFAGLMGIEPVTAENILNDPSGHALAVVCKGAHMGRTTFSTLALLSDVTVAPESTRERLSGFDFVPQTGAERLLDFWRNRHAA